VLDVSYTNAFWDRGHAHGRPTEDVRPIAFVDRTLPAPSPTTPEIGGGAALSVRCAP